MTFLKSVHSKEKDEACLGFLEEIFTKFVHRGGVICVRRAIQVGVLHPSWSLVRPPLQVPGSEAGHGVSGLVLMV